MVQPAEHGSRKDLSPTFSEWRHRCTARSSLSERAARSLEIRIGGVRGLTWPVVEVARQEFHHPLPKGCNQKELTPKAGRMSARASPSVATLAASRQYLRHRVSPARIRVPPRRAKASTHHATSLEIPAVMALVRSRLASSPRDLSPVSNISLSAKYVRDAPQCMPCHIIITSLLTISTSIVCPHSEHRA